MSPHYIYRYFPAIGLHSGHILGRFKCPERLILRNIEVGCHFQIPISFQGISRCPKNSLSAHGSIGQDSLKSRLESEREI